ncbi:MAG: galactose oxidase [Candidatus Marinimicrobia bacterium]|nr:galactose oxidase [Candidatus Neomarinimicrobiota bacterium]
MITRILLPTLILFTLMNCSDSDESSEELLGNWYELSDFEGVPRSDAVAFTIGGKAYVVTGYDGEDRLGDLWEYDPAANQWTQKADFPGVARTGAVGFGTDTKGYVGTGYDGSEKLSDFYEYDPATDIWTPIANFAGSARYGAVSFSIANKGYVGTGYDDNALKDFWEYDPATDIWTKITSLGGGKRTDAVAFVVNGKGYVCGGIDNGTYETDFWEFDPATHNWSEKRKITNYSDESYDNDYSTITGTNKVAFAINGYGYIATGGTGTTGTTVWAYDPVQDFWEEKTSLEASARISAVAFALHNTGYITTGRNGSYYFDDLWGFGPDAEVIELDKITGY